MNKTVDSIFGCPLDNTPQMQVHFRVTRDNSIDLSRGVSDEAFGEMKRKRKQVTRHSANPQKDEAFAIGLEHFFFVNFDTVLNYFEEFVQQNFTSKGRLIIGSQELVVLKGAPIQSIQSGGGSYNLPASTSTMRIVYAIPTDRYQMSSSFICLPKKERVPKKEGVVKEYAEPGGWLQNRFICVDNSLLSKVIVTNRSPIAQVYLVIDFVKDSPNAEERDRLKNESGRRVKLMEDPNSPYWENRDEILDLIVDILKWQKQNRNKVPLPDEFLNYQRCVLGRFLTRVNKLQLHFEEIEQHRMLCGQNCQLGFTFRSFFDLRQRLSSCYVGLELELELELELKSLVDDIIKLGECYERLDLIPEKVPEGHLKGLANELLNSIRECEVLSSSLGDYFAAVLQYFPFYLLV